jgi:hypothetical protein
VQGRNERATSISYQKVDRQYADPYLHVCDDLGYVAAVSQQELRPLLPATRRTATPDREESSTTSGSNDNEDERHCRRWHLSSARPTKNVKAGSSTAMSMSQSLPAASPPEATDEGVV